MRRSIYMAAKRTGQRARPSRSYKHVAGHPQPDTDTDGWADKTPPAAYKILYQSQWDIRDVINFVFDILHKNNHTELSIEEAKLKYGPGTILTDIDPRFDEGDADEIRMAAQEKFGVTISKEVTREEVANEESATCWETISDIMDAISKGLEEGLRITDDEDVRQPRGR